MRIFGSTVKNISPLLINESQATGSFEKALFGSTVYFCALENGGVESWEREPKPSSKV